MRSFIYLVGRRCLILYRSHSHHWRCILFLMCHTLVEKASGFLKGTVHSKETQERKEKWRINTYWPPPRSFFNLILAPSLNPALRISHVLLWFCFTDGQAEVDCQKHTCLLLHLVAETDFRSGPVSSQACELPVSSCCFGRPYCMHVMVSG